MHYWSVASGAHVMSSIWGVMEGLALTTAISISYINLLHSVSISRRYSPEVTGERQSTLKRLGVPVVVSLHALLVYSQWCTWHVLYMGSDRRSDLNYGDQYQSHQLIALSIHQ